jgi:putative OPT family oligopeptide transporter
LLGVCIAWGVAVPILTGLDPTTFAGAPADAANVAWTGHVRLIGAGIIAVGGTWTVVRLFAPMVASIRHALTIALIGRDGSRLPRQERDIPMTWVGAAAAILTLPLGALVAWFVVPDLFAPSSPVGVTDHIGLRLAITLLVGVTFFVVVFGFLMATACGYMAGLLGSSSSPISGVGILTVILVSLILRGLSGAGGQPAGWVVAVALFVTSLIVTIASIANDNLQDLKTGQLVDATPWQQQVALMIGVAVGAAVTPPLLDLLVNTYGIAGAPLRPEMDAAKVLAAPQASLIAEIAGGIVGGHLPWNMVITGIALGMPLIGLEELLRHRGRQFPVLTVGIGLYLPPTVSLTIALGGVVGWLAHRTIQRQARSTGDSDQRVQEHRRRRGVLLASGFLVGESFVGVLLAGVGALTGADTLKLVPPDFARVATWLGLAIFIVAVVLFYRAVSRPPATAVELRPATNEG